MDCYIRMVKLEDIGAVSHIESLCFPEAEAASKDRILQRIIQFPDSFLVALQKDQIVGFVNGCVTDDTAIRDDLYQDSSKHRSMGAYQAVFGLVVLPQFQHMGVGCGLMEQFIKNAKAANRKGLILTCKKEKILFYSRLGYENRGVSDSVHGGAIWYNMIYLF